MSTPPGGQPDQTIGYSPTETDADPPRNSLLNQRTAAVPITPVSPGLSSRPGSSRSGFRSQTGEPIDPDKLVGPYEVLDELGKGGMGVVYRARHVNLNRIVALKMILGGAQMGRQHVERFMTEAEAVARLHHAGIVQVYDVGEHNGQPFMAMELIDGGSLAQKLDGKPQNARFAAQTAETLCRAISVAHQFNVIHRDLKPHNVLMTRDGQPKVTDFGLAKDMDRLSSNTRAGSILGTPSYMAPEQAAGRVNDIGPGTDVYALGAILYEMLTGRPPFRGESPIDTIRLVLDGEVIPPRQLIPKVPRDLDTICLKSLQKPVHRRYLTAQEMAEDLLRFLNGEPIHARPIGSAERFVKWVRRRPTTASLIAVGVLAFAGFLALGVWSYVAVTHQAALAREAQAEAEKALSEGTRKMVRLNVSNGTRLMDDGDYLGSVLWFAEALRQEQGGPDREWVHRVRLAAVIERCPRPAHLWLHEAPLSEAVYDATGKIALTAGEDGVARAWVAATGKPAGPPLEHGGPIRHAAVGPDGARAATAGADGTIKLWDVAAGKLIFTSGLGVQFTGVVFSPDGSRVLACGAAGRARVWDAATGREVSTMTSAFSGPTTAQAFAPDGARYVLASTDGTARAFDTATSQAAGFTFRHSGAIASVDFSPDGTKILTGSVDGTAMIWDSLTGNPLLSTPVRHPAAINAVQFGPAGKKIATASDDRTAQVWDAATGRPLGRPAQHASRIQHVEFSPDGRWYATGSDDNTVRVWDANTGSPVTPPFRYSATPVSVHFSPDGFHLLIGTQSRLAHVWDLIPPADLTAAAPAPPPAAATGGVRSAVSPDGRFLVSFGGGQVARVRTADGHEPITPPLRTGASVAVAGFSPDGSRVATGDDEGAVQVWNAADGKPLWQTAARHASRVLAVAFTPDGGRLVTGSEDNTIRVWDAATGRALVPPIMTGSSAARVAFDPDGKLVYTVTTTGEARVWDAATGEPLTPPTAPRTDWFAALTPDPWPVDDLRALGRLFGGQKLSDAGDVIPIEVGELRDEHRTLTEKYPTAFGTPRAGVRDWRAARAAEAEKMGDWFAAAWNLDRLAAASPDDPDVMRRRAEAAAKLGNWKRAAADADAVIRLQPERPDGWYRRGVARGELDDWSRAAADFSKAVELQSEPDAAAGLAAKVALESGDATAYRRITQELGEWYATGDHDPRAIRRAAWACVLSPQTGADPAKIAALAEKAQANPATVALALLRAGRPEDAAALIKPVCESHDERPTAWLVYALALAKLGKTADARPWRDKAAAWLAADRKPGAIPPSWDARFDAETLLKEADGSR